MLSRGFHGADPQRQHEVLWGARRLKAGPRRRRRGNPERPMSDSSVQASRITQRCDQIEHRFRCCLPNAIDPHQLWERLL